MAPEKAALPLSVEYALGQIDPLTLPGWCSMAGIIFTLTGLREGTQCRCENLWASQWPALRQRQSPFMIDSQLRFWMSQCIRRSDPVRTCCNGQTVGGNSLDGIENLTKSSA
jgi:hypothetical protein